MYLRWVNVLYFCCNEIHGKELFNFSQGRLIIFNTIFFIFDFKDSLNIFENSLKISGWYIIEAFNFTHSIPNFATFLLGCHTQKNKFQINPILFLYNWKHMVHPCSYTCTLMRDIKWTNDIIFYCIYIILFHSVLK